MLFHVKTLHTFLEKSIGLIGKKNIIPVYFTTRWGIHTFGVLFPIDVLILDDNRRVVKIAQHLEPNRIFFWNPKYQGVVELPAGEIFNKRISVGESVTLTE